jgi:hypothetical protein
LSFAADEPFGPGKVPVEDFGPGLKPVEFAGGFGPEGFRVGDGAGVEGFVFGEGLDVGLGGEFGRRGEDAVFAEGGFEVLTGTGRNVDRCAVGRIARSFIVLLDEAKWRIGPESRVLLSPCGCDFRPVIDTIAAGAGRWAS